MGSGKWDQGNVIRDQGSGNFDRGTWPGKENAKSSGYKLEGIRKVTRKRISEGFGEDIKAETGEGIGFRGGIMGLERGLGNIKSLKF